MKTWKEAKDIVAAMSLICDVITTIIDADPDAVQTADLNKVADTLQGTFFDLADKLLPRHMYSVKRL